MEVPADARLGDGKIRQTLHVPGLAASEDIFSTKSNVVWAFTGGGIRRLVNRGASDEVNYEVDERSTCCVTLDSMLRRNGFAKSRIRVSGTSSPFAPIVISKTAHRLQLIPVPNDGED